MPILFPAALCMALELGVYGGIAGFLHRRFPKGNGFVFLALIISMIIGRMVWGIAMFICMNIVGGQFGLDIFIAGAVTNAIPGIVIQLLLVPLLVVSIEKI